MRHKIQSYLDSLNGRTLDSLHLVCEMMVFSFGTSSIHSQCFTRIMKKESILLTTLDYQNWDETDNNNNDEWHNLSLHRASIINNKVIKTQLTNTNDLFIWLENDIQIQMYNSNGAPHYIESCEQWRIVENQDTHIVVYSDFIQQE